MLPRIIALVGQRRCGKDTVANYLTSQYGYKNIKVASALKDVCMRLFSLSDEEVEGDLKDVVHPVWLVPPRRLMQFIGTEVMQFQIEQVLPGQDRCFWVKRLCKELDNMAPDTTVVISDIRFIHEVNYLQNAYKNDVFVVTINRDTNAKDDLDAHISETEHASITSDVVIHNNASLTHLYANIEDVLTQKK